jgi:hypothetical protein
VEQEVEQEVEQNRSKPPQNLLHFFPPDYREVEQPEQKQEPEQNRSRPPQNRTVFGRDRRESGGGLR